MKNATVVFGPGVETSMRGLIDYLGIDDLPTVLRFLERLQDQPVGTLSSFPESGPLFQGTVRMLVVESYTFLYEYRADQNEVHVLDLKMPGQNWR